MKKWAYVNGSHAFKNTLTDAKFILALYWLNISENSFYITYKKNKKMSI